MGKALAVVTNYFAHDILTLPSMVAGTLLLLTLIAGVAKIIYDRRK